MRELEKEGFDVIFLPVDEYGIVSLEALEEAVNEDTALVSVMMVNNEVGSLQPVREAADIVHGKSPEAFFHVDAVQAFGKYRIDTRASGIDLLSVSAHKLHGPKGTGLLYISDRIKLPPMIYGGGQQKALRSGTENAAGIAGFALAAKMAYEDLDKDMEDITALRDHMVSGLSAFEGVFINGPAADIPQKAAPHIVNASFTGVRSEVLLHSLEDKGIYISAGSACSSHKRTPSATLKAMGLSKERMESAVRFSFSKYTTMEEIDETLDAIGELLPMLRRFTRR